MSPKSTSATRILYWFRTDLRLHDSPALLKALDLKPASFFPVWCWDVNYVLSHRVGVNRFRFLLESMEDVSQSITRTNPNSQLLVLRGDPTTLIPTLCKKWGITHLCFEQDLSGYARKRDESIRQLVKDQCKGVQIIEEQGHYLYSIQDILEKNGKKPTMSMSALQKAVSKLPVPPRPRDAPKTLPDPLLPDQSSVKDRIGALKALAETLSDIPHYNMDKVSKPDLNAASAGGDRLPDAEKGRVSCYDTVYGPDQKSKTEKEMDGLFGVPTLASLGMDPVAAGALPEAVIKGGETEALRRLDALLKRKHYLATFAKPKTSPAQPADDPATTVMSPYLKFGAISVRRLWYDVQDVIKEYKGKDKTSIPENYEGQLLFREMYAVGELAIGDEYQQIKDNKISRYMDWYLPNVYDADGKRIEPRPRGDEASERRLELFVQGRTGFPWIDALVRQLRATGWIHHLGRHSLAAFLTRGQCWISWERGSELFESWLLDWDPCANPGNWSEIACSVSIMCKKQLINNFAIPFNSTVWLSCSAYFSQYFRVYGVASFPAKYDKSGSLVRRYKYIYAPHTAPIAVQKQAKCIIGKDYPHPMLDEKEEKAKCLARCKAAFAAGYYGTSKEVLEGKAEAILRKAHGQPEPEIPNTDKAVSKGSKIPDWAKPSVGVKDGSAKPKSQTKSDQDDDEKEEDNDQHPDTADHDDDHDVEGKGRGQKKRAVKDADEPVDEDEREEDQTRRSKRPRTSATSSKESATATAPKKKK
ncbi:unnamed protein product [Tilletia laevis]|uniref:Photolyase/cryptochrome alpha/beta domain-containing protein n=3 Tax=Tilletia TaxID=13289 RepID=A0A8X7SX97_9BASI|nr:hypothetical protein CF336_g4335 [Tilletia laevis]KAE8247773.1 hypothetical protein A4X06_0g4200 [Tilletia controversa]CAD6892841.1 unnamed protein product [Tilletia caries]KAE8202219.1 hypothetical protein CF335_g3500 [Tilletia laevis]CAD6904616.1 unnamed protein product [Tilletia caries]